MKRIYVDVMKITQLETNSKGDIFTGEVGYSSVDIIHQEEAEGR